MSNEYQKEMDDLKDQYPLTKKHIRYAVYVLSALILLELLFGAKYFLQIRRITLFQQEQSSLLTQLIKNSLSNGPNFSQKSDIYVDQTHIFNVPKKVWIFKENNRNYLSELCLENNINFAKESGYDYFQIDRNNFKNYVTEKVSECIEKLLLHLQKRDELYWSNFKSYQNSIAKTLILLNVLNQKGGVMTDGQFIMTQDLSWLRTIAANPYVNRGNRGIKPQVVGFYSFLSTFHKEKENIKPFKNMEEVDKYMNIFPVMQNYFISAYNSTEFLTKLIQNIYRLLIDPAIFSSHKPDYRVRSWADGDFYTQYFKIAVQMVLQDKQREIDSVKIDDYRHFAIDYFGLNLINCFYGPYKFQIIGKQYGFEYLDYLIARYTQEEFYAHAGPMLYIAKITPVDQLNSFLELIRDRKNGKKEIMEGSFLHRVFFSHSKVDFITKRIEKPFVNQTNAQWTNLPKIIWSFWNEGVNNSMINNQVCVQSVRRIAARSGYKFIEVSWANAAEYIGAETFSRIQAAINNTKLLTYPPIKSDFVRVALLLKNGGIYMDASMVPLEHFDWVINIGRFPSEFIFNRYGEVPKVFMAWHPFWGGEPGQFTVSEKYNTKSEWLLGYESAFIAAEKGSQLMNDWLQQLLLIYTKTYEQVDKMFNQYYMHRWYMTTIEHYLVPMESLKYAISRKQREIEASTEKKWESASEYYGIWSYSSYFGMQKFRDFLNLQRAYQTDNPFIYRYSQEYIQGLIGKIISFAKFVAPINKELNRFIEQTNGKFESEAHSQSFFMRHMWNSSYTIEGFDSQLKLRIRT